MYPALACVQVYSRALLKRRLARQTRQELWQLLWEVGRAIGSGGSVRCYWERLLHPTRGRCISWPVLADWKAAQAVANGASNAARRGPLSAFAPRLSTGVLCVCVCVCVFNSSWWSISNILGRSKKRRGAHALGLRRGTAIGRVNHSVMVVNRSVA